jgi:hypothetical protein
MSNRPPDWVKVIRPEAEDCYWVASDRSHPRDSRGECRGPTRAIGDAHHRRQAIAR